MVTKIYLTNDDEAIFIDDDETKYYSAIYVFEKMAIEQLMRGDPPLLGIGENDFWMIDVMESCKHIAFAFPEKFIDVFAYFILEEIIHSHNIKHLKTKNNIKIEWTEFFLEYLGNIC